MCSRAPMPESVGTDRLLSLPSRRARSISRIACAPSSSSRSEAVSPDGQGQRKKRVPFEIVAPSWARLLLVKRRPVQADWSSTKLNDHCLPDRSRAKFCKVQQSLFARTQRCRRSVWRKFCPRGIMIGFAGRPIGRAEESVGGIREQCHQIRFMLRG